jgi:hypothetical protein
MLSISLNAEGIKTGRFAELKTSRRHAALNTYSW